MKKKKILFTSIPILSAEILLSCDRRVSWPPEGWAWTVAFFSWSCLLSGDFLLFSPSSFLLSRFSSCDLLFSDEPRFICLSSCDLLLSCLFSFDLLHFWFVSSGDLLLSCLFSGDFVFLFGISADLLSSSLADSDILNKSISHLNIQYKKNRKYARCPTPNYSNSLDFAIKSIISGRWQVKGSNNRMRTIRVTRVKRPEGRTERKNMLVV